MGTMEGQKAMKVKRWPGLPQSSLEALRNLGGQAPPNLKTQERKA
uniref:Uncharacterized protein n=1 Tax=Arundo donax TaxID=35708 RepID=A0A0A9BQK0_ARUDO